LLTLNTLEVFYIMVSKALAAAQRDPQGGIPRCEAAFYGWTFFLFDKRALVHYIRN
jgi:hypothetical protein